MVLPARILIQPAFIYRRRPLQAYRQGWFTDRSRSGRRKRVHHYRKRALSVPHTSLPIKRKERRPAMKTNHETQSVQIIHQLIIPETPTGLIGEKVVYNGGVMVQLHPYPHGNCFQDDTHISIGNMKKFKP